MQYLLTPHVLFPHAHPPRSVTICKYFKNRPEPVLHIECGVCVLPKAVKAIENFLRGFCADLNISMNYIVVEFHTLNCLPHAIFLYTSCILYLLLYNNSIYELKHRYTVNNFALATGTFKWLRNIFVPLRIWAPGLSHFTNNCLTPKLVCHRNH